MLLRITGYMLIAICGGALLGWVAAQDWNDYDENTKPLDVVHDIVQNDDSGVIETDLDKTENTQVYGQEYKISGTLESVRQNISLYLQWGAFLGFAVATILIIYNGFRLVFSPLSDEEVGATKKRMLNLVFGILLIAGFYFILKIVLSLLLDVLV